MSELLKSGQVGNLVKDRNSNAHIYNRWDNSGLLEGLDKENAIIVALSLEIGAHMLLIEQGMYDTYCKHVEDVEGVDYSRFDVVIFPIIRRVISKTPEAHRYVPEIINLSKKEYDTVLWREVDKGNEVAIAYFYDTVLPKWSPWHKDREYKDYQDLKEKMYKKYIERCNEFERPIEPYDGYIAIDWEAEFCACVADKVEIIIKEYIKNKEDETS